MTLSPHAVSDPAVWKGSDLVDRDDWVLRLSDALIAALGTAASAVADELDGDPSRLLDTATVKLPVDLVEEVAADVRNRLGDELGFVVVRGLPVDDWDRLTVLVAYWTIGSALGRPLANNPSGDMVGHVADLGKDLDHPKHRAYQTNATMYYHADQCDVVGLLCLRPAKSGGQSKVASSLHAHNVLWERHPGLARALTQPLRWSRMGEVGPGQDEWYPAAVFDTTEGRLSVASGVKHIEKGHALPGSPPLPPKAREAIEVLNDICEEFHLSMTFEPGDMQFLNNAVCMHSRTGFEDWPEPERRRLLWRLWLRVPDLRPLSPYLRNWEDGIWAPEGSHNISLEPPG